MEVSLMQVLTARERRVKRQKELLEQYGKPLLCFTMNIAGPVKISPLIRGGFQAGCEALEDRLPAGSVKRIEITEEVTGCEAIYVVDMEPVGLKTIATHIEDGHGLGRLFDMDVIGPDFRKLDRKEVGGGSRNCIVCGAPGRGCASRPVRHLMALCSARAQRMEVGTDPSMVPFYRRFGFAEDRVRENFFLDNYHPPIVENGVTLTDMVVLAVEL